MSEPDAIGKMYGEVFTAEELREMRRQVQHGEISFVVCVERKSDDSNVPAVS